MTQSDNSMAADTPCPGCGNWFVGKLGLSRHQGLVRRCQPAILPAVAAEHEHIPVVATNEAALDFRANERQQATLKLLTNLRLDKLVPGTHVDLAKKALTEDVMPIVRKHLRVELLQHVHLRSDELDAILLRCTRVFAGLETHLCEESALSRMPNYELVGAIRRLLGTRDKEGTLVEDVCWDLPVDKTLKRLFKHAPATPRPCPSPCKGRRATSLPSRARWKDPGSWP